MIVRQQHVCYNTLLYRSKRKVFSCPPFNNLFFFFSFFFLLLLLLLLKRENETVTWTMNSIKPNLACWTRPSARGPVRDRCVSYRKSVMETDFQCFQSDRDCTRTGPKPDDMIQGLVEQAKSHSSHPSYKAREIITVSRPTANPWTSSRRDLERKNGTLIFALGPAGVGSGFEQRCTTAKRACRGRKHSDTIIIFCPRKRKEKGNTP